MCRPFPSVLGSPGGNQAFSTRAHACVRRPTKTERPRYAARVDSFATGHTRKGQRRGLILTTSLIHRSTALARRHLLAPISPTRVTPQDAATGQIRPTSMAKGASRMAPILQHPASTLTTVDPIRTLRLARRVRSLFRASCSSIHPHVTTIPSVYHTCFPARRWKRFCVDSVKRESHIADGTTLDLSATHIVFHEPIRLLGLAKLGRY